MSSRVVFKDLWTAKKINSVQRTIFHKGFFQNDPESAVNFVQGELSIP